MDEVVPNNLKKNFPQPNDFWKLFKNGETRFREDDPLTAIKCFEKALKYAITSEEKDLAEFSLINLKNHLIEQWHWPMLNDYKRNYYFFEALKEALIKFPVCNFLDIGTGTGIFAILASKLTDKCVGIEQNKVIYNLAKEIQEKNCLYNLLHNYSFDCSFEEKFDILLSETLDCGIFGEGILDTLIDAKQRFMHKNSIIIPGKASAIFALIEAEDIAKENFFELEKNQIIISPCCNYETNYTPKDPYDCAYLNDLPLGYRLLSDPIEGFSINFNNLQQMEYFRNNQFKEKLIFKSSKIGTAHAVVMWFSLNLYNKIELISAPNENLCWQQTIFPFYPPKTITKLDESFEFLVHVYEQRLHVIPLPVFNKETIISKNLYIADSEFDIPTNNNLKIKEFFINSLQNKEIKLLIDYTNLFLKLQKDLFLSKIFVKTDSKVLLKLLKKSDIFSYKKEFDEQSITLLFWPFSDRGTLNFNYLFKILKEFGKISKINFIPSLICLKGCVVSCEELFTRYKLSKKSETFCGVNLSPMKKFQPEYVYELLLNMFKCINLSENFDLLKIDLSNLKNYNENSLNFSKEVLVDVNSNGTFHALLLWYEIESRNNSETHLNFFNVNRFSLPTDGDIKLFAYVIKEKIELKVGQKIYLKCSLFQGDVYIRTIKTC